MNILAARLRRLADINPVTLKEIRQLVRSRFILWAMFLYPILLLVVSGCVLSSTFSDAAAKTDPAERAYEMLMTVAGRPLLIGTLILLGIVTTIVIPLFTGIRLARETGHSRMDLQFTTALTAADVVGGKLTGAFLLSLTFTALSLPFLTLAYLMRGVGMAEIAASTLGAVVLSVLSTTLAVAVGSLRLPVVLRVVLLALGYLFNGFYALIATVVVFVVEGGKWLSSDMSPWGVLSAVVAALAALLALGRAWAASNLMPAHTDFKRGLRRLELVLVVLSCIVALVLPVATGDSEWIAFVSVAIIYLYVTCGMSLFLPREVSRVVAARAPRGFIGRALTFPLMTTAASGSLFALMLLVPSILSFSAGMVMSGEMTRMSEPLVPMFSLLGEFMLVATLTVIAFRMLRVRRRLFAFGPLVVAIAMFLLQLSGMLEAMDVIDDSAAVFGNISAIFDKGRVRTLHLLYGLAGMAVFLVYLAVDAMRTFRKYRRPEDSAQ